MNLVWRGLLSSALLLHLTGCIDWADMGPSDRFKADFHYSYPLSPGGTVAVENGNGSVEISGWEQNTVEVNGTRYASSQALLDEVKIDINAQSGAVRIRTVRPTQVHHGGSGARYSIRVPRRVLLDTIASTNGAIRINDIEGTARLRTSNGSIRAEKVLGDLDAHTTNGAVEATDVKGNAKLQTTNGTIKAETSHGTLEATTTNGSIHADVTDPKPSWPVRLRSNNGAIDAKIRGSELPDVRAETSNSSVVVRLPANANARVEAHTSNSSITTDFTMSGNGVSMSKGHLNGNIGSGGPLLDLSSSNGSIKILKL